jgi:tripartite-type tricarboxylate transporter receptor subunit TctC
MRRLVLTVLSVLIFATTAAGAQDFPNRPIKVLVPYGPGGATDIVARIIGEQVRQSLGQPFVVENKPGAFGILAIEDMVRAAPDGYTLMIGNVSTNAITPVLYPKNFKIDYTRDVVPVARLVDIPAFLLAATKDFPIKTVAELIDYAKKNPGKVRYGHPGVGSYPHLDMAIFAKRAGLDMTQLPNKAGASGVVNDLLRGDAQTAFLNVASTAPLIRAGQIRALALVNDTRLPDWPAVPTVAEAGFPNAGTQAWQAVFAPAGTPQPVLEAIFKAVVEAMKAPAVQQAFEKQGFRTVPSASLAEAKTWLASEMETWRKITSEIKIEGEN